MSDFIEIYPSAIPPAVCQQIIDRFESSGQATRGRTGTGVDTTLKDSFDIAVSGRPDWKPIDSLIQQTAFLAFRQYVRK